MEKLISNGIKLQGDEARLEELNKAFHKFKQKLEQNKQEGGALQTNKTQKETLIDNINQLVNLSAHYNRQTIVQLYGLMYDKDTFDAIISSLSGARVDDISTNDDLKTKILDEMLFYKIDGDVDIFKEFCINIGEKDIEKYIARDTHFYNNIMNKNDNTDNKYIAVAKISSLLTKNKAKNEGKIEVLLNRILASWTKFYGVFMRLVSNLIDALQKCTIFYNKLLANNRNIINEINKKYYDMYKKNQKVFLYVGERTDNNIHNPRFNFKKGFQQDRDFSNKNDYLTLDYINVDGHYAFTDTDTDRANLKRYDEAREEKYKFPYNERVYLGTDNKVITIANDALKDLETKLVGENREPVCFIGYGQSGSGKTSSLINLRIGEDDTPGILMHLLKNISNKVKFLEISANNIYINHNRRGQTSADKILPTLQINSGRPKNEQDYKVDKIGGVFYSAYYGDGFPTNIVTIADEQIQQGDWYIYKKGESGNPSIEKDKLGPTIIEMFDQREINPTPNNPDSSRSHVIITIKMYENIPEKTEGEYNKGDSVEVKHENTWQKGKIEGKITSINNPVKYNVKINDQTTVENVTPNNLRIPVFNKIAVCDFAGVENVFPCESLEYIKQFEEKVRESKKYGIQGKDRRAYRAYMLVDEACCVPRQDADNTLPEEFNRIHQELWEKIGFSSYDRSGKFVKNRKEAPLVNIIDNKPNTEYDLNCTTGNLTRGERECDLEAYKQVKNWAEHIGNGVTFDFNDYPNATSAKEILDTLDGEIKEFEKTHWVISYFQIVKLLDFVNEKFTRTKEPNKTVTRYSYFNKYIKDKKSIINPIKSKLKDLYIKMHTSLKMFLQERKINLNDASIALRYGNDKKRNQNQIDKKEESYKVGKDLQYYEYIQINNFPPHNYSESHKGFKIISDAYSFYSPSADAKPQKITDTLNTFANNWVNDLFPKYMNIFANNDKKFNPIDFIRTRNPEIFGVLINDVRDYNKLLYKKYRFQSLVFNCKLHRKEGYMINAFLSKIGPSIKEIVLNQIKLNNNGYLPFYLDMVNPFDCFDSDIGVNKYDFMYDKIHDFKQKSEGEKNYTNADFNNGLREVNKWEGAKILTDEEFDLTKINFAYYLAVHTSISSGGRHKYRNNPPTPPFLDVGRLKYYKQLYDKTKTKENKNKLTEELNKFLKFMNNYKFYKDYINSLKTKNQITSVESSDNPSFSIKPLFEFDKFVKYIENNNAATLVGTLQDCYKFASLNPDYIPSSNHLMDAQKAEEPYTSLVNWEKL